MKITRKQIFISSAGFILALILLFAPQIKIPIVDSQTDAYFKNAITKAGVAYATCRIINGSISLVMNSRLNLSPSGIGLDVAAGQILQPVFDMSERVSNVIVMAITSLGIQKLAYEISIAIINPILAVLLMILSVLMLFKNNRLGALQNAMMRLIVIFLIARLALPLSALSSQYLQKHFFDQKIEETNMVLEDSTVKLREFRDFSMPESQGFLSTLKNSGAFMVQKSREFKDAIVWTSRNMDTIIANLLELILIYIGIFIIQVIALPLLVFWILIKFSKYIFDYRQGVNVLLSESRQQHL